MQIAVGTMYELARRVMRKAWMTSTSELHFGLSSAKVDKNSLFRDFYLELNSLAIVWNVGVSSLVAINRH